MPKLHLIDITEPVWPETEPYKETITHEVADKEAAKLVLRYDLNATSDPIWADATMFRFMMDDNIKMPNGEGHWFQVIYQA